MGLNNMSFLKDADSAILAAPMIVVAGVGTALGALQLTPYAPVKAIGRLGSYTAAVLTPIAGVPLAVYSFAKYLFATGLNQAAFKRFEMLQSFENYAEIRFKVSLFALSGLPIITLLSPDIVSTAYSAYKTGKAVLDAWEEFKQSDIYISLNHLYMNCQDIPKSSVTIEEID